MSIVKLDSVESTNKYCEALDLAEVEDFTCYWALEQTAGIGQRGNHWEAEAGKNLTFSLVLHPIFLLAERQFKLTEALSLALIDFLSPLAPQGRRPQFIPPLSRGGGRKPEGFHLSPSIKWPNDIYVGNRKICGTLVSTHLTTQAIKQSSNQAIISSAICGIGLNVNQTVFPDWVPNPTSLALLSGKEFELEPLLKSLLSCIEKRYCNLKSELDPETEYLSHLLNFNFPARYQYQGKEIIATITGVDPHGHLLLATSDGQNISCNMNEISLLLPR